MQIYLEVSATGNEEEKSITLEINQFLIPIKFARIVQKQKPTEPKILGQSPNLAIFFLSKKGNEYV